jgi:hypothetical protein
MARLAVALVIACMAQACTSESGPVLGPPTGSTCPQGSTLTYANFGQAFMEHYCTKCHSTALKGHEARMGAPVYHDFDVQEKVQDFAIHIDRSTAAGPDSINTGMPEDDPKPTLAERYMLGEWLACGAP